MTFQTTEPPFRFRQGTRPLLISMPHVGTHVPPALAARLTDEAQRVPDTDWHLERLYDFADALGASVLVATHSRFVIDLNRPPDGASLYPGQSVTGLCPVDLFDDQPLYRDPSDLPGEAEIAARREAVWQPYHAQLAQELARIKAQHGVAALWDAHSIRSVLPRFFAGRLPDLNLGTADGASCSPLLAEQLLAIGQSAPGYTAVLNPQRTKFVYRDELWTGADLIGLGVASFSHAAGVHYQNVTEIEPYLAAINAGQRPIKRAFRTSREELMIREFILQMKLGRVKADYFQKKFGILDMNMKQASNSEVKEGHKKSNAIEVPGCNNLEKEEILKIILGRIPEKGNSYAPNFRYLIFRIFFGIIIPAVIFIIFSMEALADVTYFPFVLAYLILVGFMIYFGYKNYRLFSNNDFIIIKHGAWDVEHEIIEPHKIQAITTTQYFWHKSSDVGHLTLHTAAGDVGFHFGNFTEIKQLVNFWLYQVETSKENWM